MIIAKSLKEIRIGASLTQPEAAKIVGIPFRTYCRYEDDAHYVGTFKYKQMVSILLEKTKVDEEHGILSLDSISEAVGTVLKGSSVMTCYLFGSYAKGKARPDSDIDLLITGAPDDVGFYEVLGKLEKSLHKKVDLLRIESAVKNVSLMNEILKDGIKIYG